MSKKQLAAEMGFDPSYVSHVEARRHRPTEDFARRAEAVLQAGGVIWQRFREYDEARQARVRAPPPRPEPTIPEQWLPPGPAGLVVEHEHATLSYVDGGYRCVVRRELYNAGREPVTRYLVRIAVDRYPGEPERSNRHYRDHPLTWAELDLDAHAAADGADGVAGQAGPGRVQGGVAALRERRVRGSRSIPGERTTIEYGYTVGEDKWGHWFQRAVRLPTRRLSVHLDFPARLRPVVWGVETSLTAEAGRAADTGRRAHAIGDRTIFDWSTEDPGSAPGTGWSGGSAATVPGRRARAPASRPGSRPSDLMRSAGIAAAGRADAGPGGPLVRPARQADAGPGRGRAAARRAASGSPSCTTSARAGPVAAPQLGIDWAAAVVRHAPDRRRASRADRAAQPAGRRRVGRPRRTVRGLSVLLRRPRPGLPAAADRGRARELRRRPDRSPRSPRRWPGWWPTRWTTSAGCSTPTGCHPTGDWCRWTRKLCNDLGRDPIVRGCWPTRCCSSSVCPSACPPPTRWSR